MYACIYTNTYARKKERCIYTHLLTVSESDHLCSITQYMCVYVTMNALSGVALDEGTGATMSDDDVELYSEVPLDMGFDGHDMMGFGPLIPTESERSLMERVRQELKIELKQVNQLNPLTSN